MAEAEPTLEMNDPSFLPITTAASDMDTESYHTEEPHEITIEQILGGPRSVVVDNAKGKEAVVEEQEAAVESPTTREGFVFKCIFCDQILTAADNPKMLECLHNSCGSCVNSRIFELHHANKGNIDCPFCTMPSDMNKIIQNQFLLEMTPPDDAASKSADLKCSSCSDDAMATSYCVDCSEYICDSCVQAHQRLKITKDHSIKSKEDAMNEQNAGSNGVTTNLYCSIHPNEKLSLFCETCDMLTCRDCQLSEHRQHKYKFTNEIASGARKYIAETLKDVGYKRALLTSAMKVIDDRQNLITEKKQTLVTEITQLVVKLTNTINVRGKQLVAKLTEVCDSKQTTLQEKKQALEQLSKMTDHCLEFTQYALDNGSDTALLYSKKQVTEHLRRIKCKRADIPNPEIPVRINLALDKVPDLIKVMSTIGQIVVDGRVYLSQSQSPPNIPPHGSPSPGQSGRQQSPIHPHMLPQTSPSGYQQMTQASRPAQPPPYGAYQGGSQQPYQPNSPNMQNLNSTLGQVLAQPIGQSLLSSRMPPVSRPPGMPGSMPPSLTMPLSHHMSMNHRLQSSRPLHQRAIIPRMANNAMGPNHQQQQVSSSTHPQILQDRSNLRHLLQPNSSHANGPVYVQTGPAQYQAVQPNVAQQYQIRFPSPGPPPLHPHPQQSRHPLQIPQPPQQQQPHHPQQNSMYRPQGPSRMGPAPPSNQMQQRPPGQQFGQQINVAGGGAKWHIPQQHNNGPNRNMTLPTINDNFKITLRQQVFPDQNKNQPATVTSTIPKTPSPNHVQGRSDTERNLDKFCEDSVKDLMATIAKLDSNGVQVLAEGRQKGGSPHVDSSTGDAGPSSKVKSEIGDSGKDDPNEDWCAVCMDGGELVCCDKCPKVFHQYCHIPNLTVEENDTWQCLLCMNFADIPENINEAKEGELGLRDRKLAERLVLELYCQYDNSLPFREIIGPEHEDYHAIVKKPMALDTIRQKLNWNAEHHYQSIEDLVRDIRLMFKNAYLFNHEDSQVYVDAKVLEKFFDEQLEKLIPKFAYECFEDEEDDLHPPSRKYRRIVTD